MNQQVGALAKTMWRFRVASLDHYLLFGLLPLLLPFVRRAGPPMLVIAALCSALTLLSDARARQALLSNLRSAPVLAVAALLCWATATLLWTPWLSRGGAAVASGWLIFAACILLASRPARDGGRAAPRLLTLTIAGGAAFVALDLLARRFGLVQSATETFRFNMVLVSLVILFCASLRDAQARPRGCVTAALALAIAIAFGESETAKVAFAAGMAAYVGALLLPRAVVATGLGIGVSLVWIGFDRIAAVAANLVTLFPELARSGHAAERIGIWDAFSKLAFAGFPWGWGVESVAMAPSLPFFATAAAPVRAGLDWMHPHNNVIQIATEMGYPGLALGLALSLIAVAWVYAYAALTAPRAALVAAAFTVALISHGLWQMWFWSAVVIAVLALRSPGTAPDPAAAAASGCAKTL